MIWSLKFVAKFLRSSQRKIQAAIAFIILQYRIKVPQRYYCYYAKCLCNSYRAGVRNALGKN